MASGKAVSDEKIIAALIQSQTIEQAATVSGCSARTIYTRMKEKEFKALYAHSKADMLRGAVMDMNRGLSIAVTAVTDILQDDKVNPAVRLQAAQTLFNNAGKYYDMLQKAEHTADNADSNDPISEMFDFPSLLAETIKDL